MNVSRLLTISVAACCVFMLALNGATDTVTLSEAATIAGGADCALALSPTASCSTQAKLFTHCPGCVLYQSTCLGNEQQTFANCFECGALCCSKTATLTTNDCDG